LKWNFVKSDTPPLHEYVLVRIELRGEKWVSISRWMGESFDIKPDGTMPWFKGNKRERGSFYPEEWMRIE
jgi:hypothetical protein